MIGDAEWDWVDPFGGRRLGSRGARAPRCRCCCRAASTPWKPGARPCATGPGASASPAWASGCGAPRTWSTGPPSARRSTEFGQLLAGLATGTHGPPPASVTVISGDIHHSYLAQVGFPAGTRPRSAVYQAVCSPIHNLLPESFRRTQKLATSRAGALLGTALARLARVPRPQISWRITRGPWFRNMLCALEFDGRAGRIRFAGAGQETPGSSRLETLCETSSAAGSAHRGE